MLVTMTMTMTMMMMMMKNEMGWPYDSFDSLLFRGTGNVDWPASLIIALVFPGGGANVSSNLVLKNVVYRLSFNLYICGKEDPHEICNLHNADKGHAHAEPHHAPQVGDQGHHGHRLYRGQDGGVHNGLPRLSCIL